MQDEDYVAKLPAVVALAGIAGTCGFSLMTVACFWNRQNIGVGCIGAISLIMSLGMLLAYLNCRIWYDVQHFIVGNIAGLKREYQYSDITGMRFEYQETYLFVGKRRITLTGPSHMEFLDYAQSRYRTARGHAIKVLPFRRDDLFRGHIMGARDILIAQGLVAMLPIILLGYLGWNCWKDFHPVANAAVFSEIESNDDEITLYSVDGKQYTLPFIADDFDITLLENMCKEGKEAELLGNYFHVDSGETVMHIYAMRYDGEDIVRWEDTKEFLVDYNIELALMGIGFGLIWFLFCVCSVIVGRNPRKYPKLVKFFFKEECIRYF